MKTNWQLVSRILFGVLLAIVGYFGKLSVVQLLSIQKQLTQINVQLIEIRKDILSKEDIREIVEMELLRRGIK